MRTRIDDYASIEMRTVWSPEYRIRMERELWVLVMELQANLGVLIPEEAIETYREIAEAGLPPNVLRQIGTVEETTKHDLQARLAFFNRQAGHSYAHWGLTSCDITENATLLQIRNSLEWLMGQVRRVLTLLAGHIEATRDVVVAARTHNQPAQATLLGKRFATVADELLSALGTVEFAYSSLPCRGLTGAVGTAQDLVTLVGGQAEFQNLNADFIEGLGFKARKSSQGQIYSRSEDLLYTAAVQHVVAGCVNLARMVRLESAYPRMWENFDDGQVGSSAMPHKRNPIRSERICGLGMVLQGYATMITSTAGQQWYEGDVSDSVTRRVALPGLFMTADAVLDNTAQLLQGLDLSKDAYEAETTQWQRALRTGDVLSAALLAGADRSDAYRAIQDERIDGTGLTEQQVLKIMDKPFELPEAQAQIDEVLQLIKEANDRACRSEQDPLRSEESDC